MTTETIHDILAEMRDYFDDHREAFDEFKLRIIAALANEGRDAARYRWLRENHNADLLAEDIIDEAMQADAGGE